MFKPRKPTAETAARGRGRIGGLLVFTLYFLSIVLLVLSRLENDVLVATRGTLADLAAPVLETASLPGVYVRRVWKRAEHFVDTAQELERLRDENQRLRQWRRRAERLDRQLSHMRALLNAVEEPALGFASARVIGDARGPFIRSVLLNIGTANGVKAGYAVINGDGLVGRTVHVGEAASRVILLNDLNSRIPVLVGPSAERAILVGGNGVEPRLEFLSRNAAIYDGDQVHSSGHGGLLPRGLRIGTVAANGAGERRVRTHAKLNELDYVSVLFFNSPVILANKLARPGRSADARKEGEARAASDTAQHARARAAAGAQAH